MKEQLEQRLNELKTEFQAGQKMLAELEAKQANLQQALLRISGAMQVLEELLAAAPQASAGAITSVPAADLARNGVTN
jgi:predicted nuclease with TOPRIM domain